MKKKITVYKLFVASILVLGTSFWFVVFNNSSFNRLSHECVQNYNQQGQDILHNLGYITEQEAAQHQGYCETGFHPEIKDQWKTVNSYVTAVALILFVPTALCTGLVLAYRSIRKALTK